jgi:hypothetical protein
LLVLPHAELSMVLCTDKPLEKPPLIEVVTLPA